MRASASWQQQHALTVMLRQVRSHGLDIDAQLWSVHKRFSRAYLCACVRSRRDWLRTKQYQRVHEFIFIKNSVLLQCDKKRDVWL